MIPASRPSRHGLIWMAVAQLFFAVMNVCTRRGAQELPWPEIAAGRFVIGAIFALTVAVTLGARAPLWFGPSLGGEKRES
jgi:hypothetical protein